jgi:hypothetical protein
LAVLALQAIQGREGGVQAPVERGFVREQRQPAR